ncbi:MAG: M20 family metallopeptidase [Synergistaceae bacterium]|jgi:glutamate carboxypeptidase|nr:M20 family metallopeptidase [Synergistaceae bacterium]
MEQIMDRIYDALKRQRKEMLEVLKVLVEHESPSHNKALGDVLAGKLAEFFEELTGGRTKRIPVEGYGDFIRGEFGDGEEQIFVVGHYDTVFPEGTLRERPFRVEGNKGYGPGIFDMKGGLTAGLFALKTLKDLHIPLGKKVVFLFNSDEEPGSLKSRPIIEEEAAKSKYALVLEPAGPGGSIKTMRKGVGRFTLDIGGKAVHSGADFTSGVSAVNELARQILFLSGLTDLEKGTTVNVGRVEGGTVSNVVAEWAHAEIDLRIATEEEGDRVIPQILGLKPCDPKARVEITGGLNRPPYRRTKDVEALYLMAKDLAAKYLDFDLPEISTGGASDGNFTALHVPTLDGLGAYGEGSHSASENIDIDRLPERSALIALVLANLK